MKPLILAAALASVLAAGPAFAQATAPAGKAAPAAPAGKAAPAAPAAPDAAAAKPAASSWIKLCEKGTAVNKGKDGKEVKEEHTMCLTHHERIDAATGIVLVSAAIRQIDGEKDPMFMVMLPLGMAIVPGMQVGVYPKDMWDKIQKGEKVDDSAIKPIKVPYNLCHSAGCTGEIEATKEMVDSFKTSGGLIVYGISGAGRPVAFPIPLNGFDVALAGKPADNQEYAKQRAALMRQIAENQQKVLEEYRKKNEELQKSQGQLKTAPAQPEKAPAKK